MMNTSAYNTGMSSSAASASGNNALPCLKTYFKTPEGKNNLQYEKTYPADLPHSAHGKTVTQVTLAHLNDKPMQAPSSSLGLSIGVRSAAARLLGGGGNGSRALSFVGGNGGNKSLNGTSTRIGSLGTTNSNSVVSNSNICGKGTYLVSNVGDAIFISDLSSQDKFAMHLTLTPKTGMTCLLV